MQTGQDVQILDDPHPAFVFIWVIILFLGLQKGRIQFPGLQLKQSTDPLHMLWLNRFGCASFLPNFIGLLIELLLSTVTTFQQFIWRPILFIIVARSTLKSTFISSARKLLLVKFEFFMSQQALNLLTSSPKDCQLHHSPTYVPVSTP